MRGLPGELSCHQDESVRMPCL